jgi:hypothetical protein
VHTFSVGITIREHDSDLGGVHHFLDRRIVAFGHRRAVGRSGFLDDRLPRAALVLSAILGAMFQRHSLIAGAVVMFAQLPVVVAFPLLTAGVIYAALLSIPAMMLSWLFRDCGVGASAK